MEWRRELGAPPPREPSRAPDPSPIGDRCQPRFRRTLCRISMWPPSRIHHRPLHAVNSTGNSPWFHRRSRR
ncbi:hypothetical protein TIFTF001_026480 [Ficus carica]|uniref:Uncharacterized protein n=1 Tax=Ficus carica TaxID=3494 RepID=A0AA88DL79_FICCA|nr:hypothetical protein TIFTF001_026480 [Ficus carica]